MKQRISIVVAEDQMLIRKLLIALLKQQGLDVIGEAANGKELVGLLKQLRPDIILMDLKMPVMSGIEALKIIKIRFPRSKVIVLSSQQDLPTVKTCIALGVKSFLSKDCEPELLIKAILNVDEKGFYLEEKISNEILQEPINSLIFHKQKLSLREKEIINELCNGLTEKEIAVKLNISPHTVHFHKKNIYSKTSTHNIAGLLKYTSYTEIQA